MTRKTHHSLVIPHKRSTVILSFNRGEGYPYHYLYETTFYYLLCYTTVLPGPLSVVTPTLLGLDANTH